MTGPLYNEHEVITEADLVKFAGDLYLINSRLRWWQWREKLVVVHTLNFISELTKWLERRKGKYYAHT